MKVGRGRIDNGEVWFIHIFIHPIHSRVAKNFLFVVVFSIDSSICPG